METVVEKIPVSLRKNLSERLINIILDSEKKDLVSPDLAKRIIYFWRQDQLATPASLATLIHAAIATDKENTYSIMDELGLNEIVVAIKAQL